MFELPVGVIMAFMAAIVIVAAWIVYLLKKGDKTGAEKVYSKAKYLAIEVVTYVEQLSKSKEMTNEEKKALATEKLGAMLKEFYGIEVSPVIIDFAIEVAIRVYNTSLEYIKNKD
jgi:hypothetical protein